MTRLNSLERVAGRGCRPAGRRRTDAAPTPLLDGDVDDEGCERQVVWWLEKRRHDLVLWQKAGLPPGPRRSASTSPGVPPDTSCSEQSWRPPAPMDLPRVGSVMAFTRPRLHYAAKGGDAAADFTPARGPSPRASRTHPATRSALFCLGAAWRRTESGAPAEGRRRPPTQTSKIPPLLPTSLSASPGQRRPIGGGGAGDYFSQLDAARGFC